MRFAVLVVAAIVHNALRGDWRQIYEEEWDLRNTEQKMRREAEPAHLVL